MEVSVAPWFGGPRESAMDAVAQAAGALDDLFMVVRNLSACFVLLNSAPRTDFDTTATVLEATRSLIDKAEAATKDQPATPMTRELGKVLLALRQSHRELIEMLPSSAGHNRQTPSALTVAELLRHTYGALRAVVAHTPYAAVFYADGCVCHPDVKLSDSASTSLWRS